MKIHMAVCTEISSFCIYHKRAFMCIFFCVVVELLPVRIMQNDVTSSMGETLLRALRQIRIALNGDHGDAWFGHISLVPRPKSSPTASDVRLGRVWIYETTCTCLVSYRIAFIKLHGTAYFSPMPK